MTKYRVICGCCAHKRPVADWREVEADSAREAAEMDSNPDNDRDERVVLSPDGTKTLFTFTQVITYETKEEPYLW